MADPIARNVFRFKKGMKTKLLNQVATDNPEGMGISSKGWDALVDKLKTSGAEWQLLSTRCARENVREMVREWHKNQVRVDKTTGTGADETEDDAYLREIFDLWTSRKEQQSKIDSNQSKEKKSREYGIHLRQAAIQDLKRSKACEQDDDVSDEENHDTENAEVSAPAKRQRKQAAVWSYLKDVKQSENNLKEKELELRTKQMAIDEEKVKIEKERLRLQSVQQKQQLHLQHEQQQHSFQLQQQQMEAMLSLITQITKK